MNAFQVSIDRSRVDRMFAGVAVALALPVLLSVVLAVYLFVAMDAGAQVLVLAIPVVGMAPLLLAQCIVWGATRRIEHPLTVDAHGMTFDTPRGAVSFPWEAVTALGITTTGRAPMLAVRLHPEAGPGAPGIVSTLTPGGWRVLRRQGLRLSLRAVRTSPDELGAAVGHFSNGRWAPALVR